MSEAAMEFPRSHNVLSAGMQCSLNVRSACLLRLFQPQRLFVTQGMPECIILSVLL